MKKYKIRSVILTILYMQRWDLITKKDMENHYMQKGEKQKESIDDDLEDFYRDLKDGKISESSSNTYFLPQLTEEEQKLVDDNDLNYLKSLRSENADIHKIEIQLSTSEILILYFDSESKFVRGQAWRKTSIIDLSFTQNCCSIQ